MWYDQKKYVVNLWKKHSKDLKKRMMNLLSKKLIEYYISRVSGENPTNHTFYLADSPKIPFIEYNEEIFVNRKCIMNSNPKFNYLKDVSIDNEIYIKIDGLGKDLLNNQDVKKRLLEEIPGICVKLSSDYDIYCLYESILRVL